MLKHIKYAECGGNQAMKSVIIYSSKYGTTKTCSQILAQKLTDAEIIDIKEAEGLLLSGYDTVIIGSSIRVGQINKKIKEFCEENARELLGKNLGLFICSTAQENTERDFTANFDKNLLANCRHKAWFGGELDLKKAKGIDKLVIWMVLKMFEKNENKNFPQINEKNIEEFAKIMSSK